MLAILADLHANREAIEACLDHAASHGATRHAFLGDLVGYGADPGWVVDTVMAHSQRGAIVVQGNHDQAATQSPDRLLNPEARRAIEWTRAHLSPAHLDYLAGLPLTHTEGERLYVHANGWAPARFEYITRRLDAQRSVQALEARVTFCGHTHDPALYHLGRSRRAESFLPIPGRAVTLTPLRRWLAIPGSSGQPRDGNPAACYALFDETRQQLTYWRVPYDHQTAARKVSAAGLPQRLATRLQGGV